MPVHDRVRFVYQALPLLAMVNTVKCPDIMDLLKEYQKQSTSDKAKKETPAYKPYDKMSRKEKDIVDQVTEELQLDRVVACIAAQELGEYALDPGELPNAL